MTSAVDGRIYGFLNRQMVLPNFDGSPSVYNPSGAMTFCIRITQEEAEDLGRLGVSIKGSEEEPLLLVKLSRANDWVVGPDVVDAWPVPRVDVQVRLWQWEFKGKKGSFAQLVKVTAAPKE